MPVLHDYYCPACDDEVYDVWSDDVPKCCGKEMRIKMPQIATELEVSGYFPHLREQPFESRSDLKAWAKQNNMRLAPSADKHHGARNEDGMNVGKSYSYKGASGKPNPLASRTKFGEGV